MPKTETNLYRAIIDGTIDGDLIQDGKPAEGILYPRFQESTYIDRSGVERTSVADVTYVPPGEDEVDAGGGTSMHDAKGWFGNGGWRYFAVPKGTEYSAGLYIRRGKRERWNKSRTVKGRHYQIEPLNRMTVEAYKGALDNLARAAVVRQVQLAIQGEDA